MARRELAPACLAVAQAVRASLEDVDGGVVVGVSGGADSLALAAGAAWAARALPVVPRAVVVDHGLQAGSAEVAARAADQCRGLGIDAEVVRVEVGPGSTEAAAREARLAALAAPGLPVLLGHTLDDQAESVLLGLARGSGTRSLAGMAAVRGPFRRPLLGLRRSVVAEACAAWGLEPWADPMNADPAYARVRARLDALPTLERALGPGIAEALARTASMARADADLLDELAQGALERATGDGALDATALAAEPDALRSRVLHAWLRNLGSPAHAAHVAAVDRLVTAWRGQGPVDVGSGVRVARVDGLLRPVPSTPAAP